MPERFSKLFLELFKTWCHFHFAGGAVPVPSHLLGEETFPKMQYYLVWWCPALGHTNIRSFTKELIIQV